MPPTSVAAHLLLRPFAAAQNSLLVACHTPRLAHYYTISPLLDASRVLIRGIALFLDFHRGVRFLSAVAHDTMSIEGLRCRSR
ncbi:hypothetical protein BKA58DRAFT_100394 [Alternaria rosae]|uniref:uncharacterized protein n=1 Tax=Alternaria rosae TaxID=1187941 RepID=UPI001E8D23C2|nr:uncharacterized protein BKA58DRAFT_100394 [Alternaria rosae]KAH6878675.1 hypothetical protein BKA58DRAFT_100394 [Alternaria rosae]